MLAIGEARSRTTKLGEDLVQSIFSFLQSLLDFNRIDLNQIDFLSINWVISILRTLSFKRGLSNAAVASFARHSL
jgi:hypothetical protein